MKIDEFTVAYIECALWSTNDESTPSGGEPLDRNYSEDDISPETLKKMIADCERFQRECADLLARADYPTGQNVSKMEMTGHDFWLTRNGHGAGFWDGGCRPEEVGEALADAAHKFGEFNLYVGDDGQIYGN